MALREWLDANMTREAAADAWHYQGPEQSVSAHGVRVARNTMRVSCEGGRLRAWGTRAGRAAAPMVIGREGDDGLVQRLSAMLDEVRR